MNKAKALTLYIQNGRNCSNFNSYSPLHNWLGLISLKPQYSLILLFLFFSCTEKDSTSNEVLINVFQNNISYSEDQVKTLLEKFPTDTLNKNDIEKITSTTQSYINYLNQIIADIEGNITSKDSYYDKEIIASYFFSDNRFDQRFISELSKYHKKIEDLRGDNENLQGITYIFNPEPLLNRNAQTIQYVEYHFKNKAPIDSLPFLYYLKSQALLFEKDYLFELLLKSTANIG